MTDIKVAVEQEKMSFPRRVWETLVTYQAVVVPIVALGVAFGIGALLINLQGVNPIFAYQSLFEKALLTSDGLLRTFQKATPLVFTGLAVSVALRVGLFNIGAQGQLVLGALGAAWAGYSMEGWPAILAVPAALTVGVLFGAVWASIAGLLKARRGVHEVISTIMLNSIAVGIIDYLISYPLKEEGQSLQRTPEVVDAAKLPTFGFMPIGFVFAVVLAILVAWLLSRTTLGFKYNTVGKNKFAAQYAGIKIPGVIVGSMLLSGGLAGLGGAVETLGVVYRYEAGFNTGLGFDGITIALLARANPIATIPAAILIGTLRSGAASLQFDTGIQPEVVDLILAITLLLVSIPLLANLIFRGRATKNEALTGGWGN
jgi:simple sugar transport system permease protein